MCLKLLCFYFKGLPFFFFFISEGKTLEVLCRTHLSAGAAGAAQLCHRGGLVPVPSYGGTVSPLLPQLWEAEPCLAEPHAVPEFHSSQSQGKWPKLLSLTHLQPLWLHPVVPALLAWVKASGRRKVCAAFPLHLLFRFSGLKTAEQHILCHPAPPLWVSSLQQVSKATTSTRPCRMSSCDYVNGTHGR